MGLMADFVSRDRMVGRRRCGPVPKNIGDFRRDRQNCGIARSRSTKRSSFLGATASGYIQQQTTGSIRAGGALEMMLRRRRARCRRRLPAGSRGHGRPVRFAVNRALINVFFLTDRNKKDTGVDRTDITPRSRSARSRDWGRHHGSRHRRRQLESRGAGGAGRRGAEALARGVDRRSKKWPTTRSAKAPTCERAVKLRPCLHRPRATPIWRPSDLVIEAVIENAEIKKLVYAGSNRC